jgi:glycosyltransferase involved in cell wall biosynthesis
MKIGIDARFLTHPQNGGFKTYTTNLLRAMCELETTDDYFVYLDRPAVDCKLPLNVNWHVKVVKGTTPVIGMPLREQIYLKNTITKDQLDIAHFLCNTAPINLRQRYILTLHDTIQVATKNRFRLTKSLSVHKQWAIMAYSNWVINKSIRFAERIVTVSNYEKREIINQFNLPSERVTAIHLAPNPIFKPAKDSEKVIWRADWSKKLGTQNKFILGVGYEPRKNIELLIESFSILSSQKNDIDLVIVCAQESRRSYYSGLAQKLNLSEKIHVIGSLPPEDLTILYNLTEAFIYPSERESFGLPPLEAISCGTPAVVMNKTSLPEILGKAALYVDGKDPQVWANIIYRVLSEKNLRLKLVDYGLKQASTFSWKRCAVETNQIYREISGGVRKNL